MGEKRCCTCGEIKPLEEFNRLRRAKDGRQPRCRQCHKDWHAENKAHHNAMIHARNRVVRFELNLCILEYLATHPCVDCGERNPVVLEFDHLRDKIANVTTLVRSTRSWAKILEEIDKCEVVCANCHRKRTMERLNTLRWRFSIPPLLVGRPGLDPGTVSLKGSRSTR